MPFPPPDESASLVITLRQWPPRAPAGSSGPDQRAQGAGWVAGTGARGHNVALVIRGEAGVGKSALVQYVARQAASWFRVAQIAGAESEMELPYAGLHQLCRPMLAHLDALPEPQPAAVRVAFGVSSGDAPDRFLVGLATLGLLAQVAEERLLLGLVEDAEWLDGASGQVLGFVGRRLRAESVAMVFAVREPTGEHPLLGLPELSLAGLNEEDARALLATVVPGRLDAAVRGRIVVKRTATRWRCWSCRGA